MNGYQIIGLVALCVVVAFGGAVVRSLFAYGEDLRDPHGIERPRLRSRDLRPGDVIEMFDSGERYEIVGRWADAGWTLSGSGRTGGYWGDNVLDRERWERVERGEAP